MQRLLIWWMLMLTCLPLFAQQEETDLHRLFEEALTMEDTETSMWSESYETLTTLANNKINLNTATREDLQQLPFLSEAQIEEICEYLYKYGPLKSWSEMAMIASLDAPRRRLLQHFVYIDTPVQKKIPDFNHILKYGKHELTTTAHVPFYSREGDKDAYRGYPYRHSLRYTFNYGQYVKAGIIGAQDAGEPFFSKDNRWGYDYYSFYVNIRKLGRIKSMVAGRYRMRIGMGLILNNDFNFGKLMVLSSMGNTGVQIRPHSSRSEANYMQGIASTVKINNYLDISGFISYRSLDATLNKDASSVTTLLTSGYHRTASELKRKHNVEELASGANLSFRKDRWNAGATIMYSSMSLPLKPDTKQKFRRYYPEGKTFLNTGINYGYRGKRFSLQGETALSLPQEKTYASTAIATLNMLSANVTQNLSLVILQRFYSYQYIALHASSFSDGGRVQNESGLYIGANWQPKRDITLSAYTDLAYFPWARYLISQASHSWDNYLSAEIKRSRYRFSARYRLRLRETDNSKKTALINKTEHRARVAFLAEFSPWSFKTQLDGALSQVNATSRGGMITQHVAWQKSDQKLQLEANVGYFHTDDYDSRLYCYERNMMYTFSFPMYYGHGIHYALWSRYRVTKNITLTARIGTANYFDRSTIGSSHQLINHSSQTDMDFQVKWKF